MSTVLRSSLLLAALLAAGCSTAPRRVLHDFRSPPETWSQLGGGPVPPASLRVERGRLELVGEAAYVESTAFNDLALVADVAITGGDPRGILGIFVLDTSLPSALPIALAIRPGGEARVYRSSSPLEPAGGRGWQALSGGGASTTGFLRLGAAMNGPDLRFTVDGAEVERLTVDAGPGDNRVALGRWRIGLFSRGVASRWKSLVAGESDESDEKGPFRPESLIVWGDADSAAAVLAEAEAEVKRLRARPSRMQVYPVAAAFHEAFQIFTQVGEVDRAEAALALAARAEADSRESLRSLGEGEIHARAFGRLRGLSKLKTVATSAGDTIPRAAQAKLATLKGRKKPLRLASRVDSAVNKPAIAPALFTAAIREEYGALNRAEDGELKIHVRLERSSVDTETTNSTRRVPVNPQGNGLLAELEGKSATLAKKLETDLLDAQARAEVNRAAATVLGPSALAALKPFRVKGKAYELHANDGAALTRLEASLEAARARAEKEKGNENLEYRAIPAKLHTTSILLEASYEVALDGKVLIKVPKERTYLGLEQWTHARDAATGTPASSQSAERIQEALDEVRARAEARLRKAISRENLLAKLDPTARLELLVRLARESGEERDRSSLSWCLQSELGLEGSVLEKVAASLLKYTPHAHE